MLFRSSAVTYARRYGLIALAGIADTDDDGNAASEPRSAPHTGGRAKPQGDTAEKPSAVPEPSAALGEAARMLYCTLRDADYSDRPEILAAHERLMTDLRDAKHTAAEHIDTLMKEGQDA